MDVIVSGMKDERIFRNKGVLEMNANAGPRSNIYNYKIKTNYSSIKRLEKDFQELKEQIKRAYVRRRNQRVVFWWMEKNRKDTGIVSD